MQVFNKILLADFVKTHADTLNAVNRWLNIVENTTFENHNDLKKTFPSADYVGDGRYVFNIKGNKYRFVVIVVFVAETMEIRFCGTHAEYDKITDIEQI